MWITRKDPATVVLEAEDGSLATVDGPMVRNDRHPLEPEERIELAGVSIQILAIADDGMPVAARFRFTVPLEDPSLRWVRWERGRFREFAPPAIGQTVHLGRQIPSFADE